MSNFTNISFYWQFLKNIEDQLANVGQIIWQQKLVLCLVASLVNTDFDIIASLIQQTDPLLTFETARSQLLLEASRKAHDETTPAQSFSV